MARNTDTVEVINQNQPIGSLFGAAVLSLATFRHIPLTVPPSLLDLHLEDPYPAWILSIVKERIEIPPFISAELPIKE